MLWRGISVFALAAAVLSALMLVPAGAALYEGNGTVALAFAQWAALIALAATGLALGRYRMAQRAVARGEILTVIALFVVLPLAAAAPVLQAVPGLTVEQAYFEMVSTLTTTGLTTIDDLGSLSTAMHLWRAITAWFGGLIALTAAAAVFGPRNLGGYEVQIEQRVGTVGRLTGLPDWAMTGERQSAERRLAQALRCIGPSYTVLTAVLALAFLSAGVAPLTAVVQAAGVMATCGLTMGDGGFRGGMTVELLALIFMIFAATRHSFGRGGLLTRARRFRGDPEIDLAAFTIAVAAGWVLLRGVSEPALGMIGARFLTGLEAAWAAVFTTASFLSTTGYVSDYWLVSHERVGLEPPAMLLMALAAMGGGVASTAGGVKLLRSFALFQHGVAEMHQLGHPSAVSARGQGARRVGFAGAVLAWLFLMLFLLAIGVTALALSLGGAALDTSLAAAIAANTNTGAVYAAVAGDAAPSLAGFSPADRLVLCAAMILGRVEVLAVVALANPAYWR